MRIDEDTTRDRLKAIPIHERIYLYDGTRVIEFFKRSFVPTENFLVPGTMVHVRELTNEDWEGGKKQIRENSLSLKELYELYKVFYQKNGWTTPIETAFQFGLMIRRLRFYKNNWEFYLYRLGSAQIWHVAPLKPRSEVGAHVPMAEDKEQDVEVTFADMQSDQEEAGEAVDEVLDIAISTDGTKAEVTVNAPAFTLNNENAQETIDEGLKILNGDVEEVIAYVQTPEQVAAEEAFLYEQEIVHEAVPTDY